MGLMGFLIKLLGLNIRGPLDPWIHSTEEEEEEESAQTLNLFATALAGPPSAPPPLQFHRSQTNWGKQLNIIIFICLSTAIWTCDFVWDNLWKLLIFISSIR
jgi:hypothetical protein